MKIILASQSPYRKQLLENLGLEFSVCAPELNEDDFKSKESDPKNLCRLLAYEKAHSLIKKYPKHVIIGSDQLVSFESEILNKPETPKNAIDQLLKLSGKTHRLYTSICVLKGGEIFENINITELKMRDLTKDQVVSYIQKDNPIDCAGSYKLEKAGITLFETINTSDHSAIIGLPLMELTHILLKIDPLILS